MNIQNTALVEAAARLAAAQASEDDGDSQSVAAFVRSLYENFSPRDGDKGLTADELAAAALPLWRAVAGAKAPTGGSAHGRAAEAASYRDRLGIALAASPEGRDLLPLYGDAFPSAYRDYVTPEAAVADIASLETVLAGDDIAVSLSPRGASELHLKTFRRGEPVALSDVLPMLENLGLRIVNEIPFEVHPAGAAEPVWIQEFHARPAIAGSVDLAAAGPRMEEALRQVWAGASRTTPLTA